MPFAGLASFSSPLVVRIWPVFVLGRRFSGLVAIQPGFRQSVIERECLPRLLSVQRFRRLGMKALHPEMAI